VNLLLELLQINESSDDNLEAFYHGLPKEGSYGSVLAAHAIAKLMNGIEQDGIYNTDYSDAKERLNRILEKRAEGLYGKLNQETRMEMYQKFNYGGILYLHALKRPIQAVHSGIQSKVNNKATEEDMDKLHELLKVLQAAEKIGEMIKKLKPKVIKIQMNSGQSLVQRKRSTRSKSTLRRASKNHLMIWKKGFVIGSKPSSTT
jgi:hypothetical protein